jgi:hypothetical protein
MLDWRFWVYPDKPGFDDGTSSAELAEYLPSRVYNTQLTKYTDHRSKQGFAKVVIGA